MIAVFAYYYEPERAMFYEYGSEFVRPIQVRQTRDQV